MKKIKRRIGNRILGLCLIGSSILVTLLYGQVREEYPSQADEILFRSAVICSVTADSVLRSYADRYAIIGWADTSYGGFFYGGNYALVCSVDADGDTAFWVKRGDALFDRNIRVSDTLKIGDFGEIWIERHMIGFPFGPLVTRLRFAVGDTVIYEIIGETVKFHRPIHMGDRNIYNIREAQGDTANFLVYLNMPQMAVSTWQYIDADPDTLIIEDNLEAWGKEFDIWLRVANLTDADTFELTGISGGNILKDTLIFTVSATDSFKGNWSKILSVIATGATVSDSDRVRIYAYPSAGGALTDIYLKAQARTAGEADTGTLNYHFTKNVEIGEVLTINDTLIGKRDTVTIISDGLFETIATSVSMGSDRNVATGLWSFVAGDTNEASGRYSTVSGGERNTASGFHATVGGGWGNTASGREATVGGGWGNTASEIWATVDGGMNNTASGAHATVGGGSVNTASGAHATVGGGESNVVLGTHATVGGGHHNNALGTHATVGGGFINNAIGDYATVPGGENNQADASWSFATGLNAKVQGDASDTASMVFGTGSVRNAPYAFLFGNSVDDTLTSGHTFMVGVDTFVVEGTGYRGVVHPDSAFVTKKYVDDYMLFIANDTMTTGQTRDTLLIPGLSTSSTVIMTVSDSWKVTHVSMNSGNFRTIKKTDTLIIVTPNDSMAVDIMIRK